MITEQKISPSAEARDMHELEAATGNLYLTTAIIAKRANQISAQIKEELTAKLSEFATDHDNLEEVHENREQIEISMYYERLPKATLIATQEYLDDKIHFRNPEKEKRLAEEN